MKYFWIGLAFLCIAVMCATGCTSQPALNVTPAITPAPALVVTAIPTTTSTPVPTTVKIPTKVIVNVTTTKAPEAEPTDLARIKFVRYSDNDFSLDYPSAWNITKSTYTPYYCINNLELGSSVYQVCYKNETRLIGPFNFYDESYLQKQKRLVTFTSADGRIKLVSFSADFFDGLDGKVMLKPTNEWSQNQFELNYPDLTGYAPTYVGNYRFFTTGNTVTSFYDVTMSRSTRYYPITFTKETVVTTHHVYSFAWVTDSENFTKYQNLKEYLLSSITINDA
ncbi:MAG: hypothetical protein Q7T80_12070 [Methanoregula sp.]|nr:hypothetical protein [Methanoregula sp.]